MKLLKWTTLVAGTAFAVAACNNEPTGLGLDSEIDGVDPVVVTFAATQGLPGGPIGDAHAPPHMGGMAFAGAPGSPANGRGPGAAFPDSIKLTDAQKTQIQSLVDAFRAANSADLDAMKAAHVAAREARKAGKSREEIRAILEGAKAAAERVHTNAQALRTSIQGVLTASQRAWLDAHRPDRPPRTP
jgi:Spy/CpxP family protein refolding chaperone